MIVLLKTIGVIACMVMIIPLMVWGGSGSWRHGLHALKEFLLTMAVIVVPVLALAAAVIVAEHGPVEAWRLLTLMLRS